MEMNGEIRLAASRTAVWSALNAPDVLKACIPGCESLDKLSDTEFVSLVVVKVGPIRAKFAGKVSLTDIVAPQSYRILGEGQGGVAGFAKSDIAVTLEDQPDGTTLLRYGVTANIGGKIAQLGSRMIDSTARKMADDFFERFSAIVAPGAAAAGSPPAEGSAAAPIAGLGDDIRVELVDIDAPPAEPPQWRKGRFARLCVTLFSNPGDVRPAPLTSGNGGKIAIVTLNRPTQRNAMSLAMWQEIPRIFGALEANPDVRAIILTGAGGHFCSGADISEFASVRATVAQGEAYEIAVDACCDAITDIGKPTIAAVNGFCIGGGCHLAMSCDFRFADPEASFAIPAARLSIVYGVSGTRKLLTLVGLANAKRILYGAEKFSAADAQLMGLADRVNNDPLREARAFAATLGRNAPLTIAGAKTILNGLAFGMGALDQASAERAIERAVASDDYRDARQAFVDKRAARFNGR